MKALLFDLDGTLSDSVKLIINAYRLTAQEMDLPFSEEVGKSYIGIPLFTTGEMIAGKGKGQLFFDTYQKHYFKQDLNSMLQAFDGISDMIDELKKAGYLLAIVTSKADKGTYNTLEILGLSDIFDTIVTSETVTNHKPHPEPALYAMKELNVTPKDCIFIGDSTFDLQCGTQAGTLTAAVTWGACDKNTLEQENPTFIADTVAQLKQWLLEQKDK